MHFSGSIEELDETSFHLCEYCSIYLQDKFRWAAGSSIGWLQAISKMQITFKSRLSFVKSRHSGARADEKAQHTWEYVSILKRFATHHQKYHQTGSPAVRGNAVIGR
jgi:hypothetical protein